VPPGTGKTHTFSTQAFLIAQIKRRHWLLAPDEVGKEVMENWLAGVPCSWGSAPTAEHIDSTPLSAGMMAGGDCVDVFESLERYEEGVTAAQKDIKDFECHPTMLIHAYTGMGRCHAKLGRAQEARAAFEAAIAEAQRCEMPFLEMLAHRDLIVHVLDAADERESQLAALGGCIDRMVLTPAEYSAVLGSGIDAGAAVAAAAARSSTA